MKLELLIYFLCLALWAVLLSGCATLPYISAFAAGYELHEALSDPLIVEDIKAFDESGREILAEPEDL